MVNPKYLYKEDDLIKDYCFEIFFSTSHTEQSHVKILKYILGVNRKTTNIAVMSELGRYPIY
jgi:hypothetical protein